MERKWMIHTKNFTNITLSHSLFHKKKNMFHHHLSHWINNVCWGSEQVRTISSVLAHPVHTLTWSFKLAHYWIWNLYTVPCTTQWVNWKRHDTNVLPKNGQKCLEWKRRGKEVLSAGECKGRQMTQNSSVAGLSEPKKKNWNLHNFTQLHP